MKMIEHARLLEVVSYDPSSGVFTRCLDDKPIGRPDRKGYLLFSVCNQNYRAHRLAWLYMTGSWPSAEIDHINGDPGDNRWANLRQCNHQQNNHNQPMRRNNTSGVKGVSWNSRARKWHVQVCLNYKIHNGGLYETLTEADAAARALRLRLHGEFANHG